MCAVVSVTGEPIQLPHDYTIESVLVAVLYHSLKFRAVVCFCRIGAVYVIADDLNIVIGGVFHTLSKLTFNRGFRLVI